MHHTRKTHNSHNETQRRLRRILANSPVSSFAPTPHCTYAEYRYGKLFYVHPDWVDVHFSKRVVEKGGGRIFDSFEEVEFAKAHSFLVKKSKSDGKKSLYKFYKRLVHKWWRKRDTYSIKGSRSSYIDIIW